MTYIYRALKEGPSGLWSLDGLPLNDSSGYGKDASYTGSPVTTRPIVAGGHAAQFLDSGDTVTYPINSLMIASREHRSFSLEAWIKPSATGAHKIIARNNSGLFIDDLNLRMTMDFGGTIVSAEYPKLRAGNVYHVVGVYDVAGISLFVNGVEVAGVDIEDATRSLGIAATDVILTSSTTGTLVLDSVAVYSYALSESAVSAHYEYGSNYPEVVNLSTINGGTYYEFTDEHVGLYRKSKFPEVNDWEGGLAEGSVAVVDSSLVNLYDVTTDQYQTGTWTFQESFEIEAGTVLVASRITWSSPAAITVEKSEDGGTTWTPLSNGGQIVTNRDLSVEGYSVSIRVTIPASAEQISVDELVTSFYKSLDVRGSDEDLPATVRDPASATVAESSFPAASFNDNAGINLAGASGGLSIPGDTEFGGYFAVEMTVKLYANSANATILWVDTALTQPQITTDASGQWVFSNLTALYVDGVAVTSPAAITPGIWHHVLAVFPESLATVYVGNNVAGTAAHAMRIGHLATYSETVSASDAVAIYNAWTGAPAAQIAEEQVGNIAEKTLGDSEGATFMLAADSGVSCPTSSPHGRITKVEVWKITSGFSPDYWKWGYRITGNFDTVEDHVAYPTFYKSDGTRTRDLPNATSQYLRGDGDFCEDELWVPGTGGDWTNAPYFNPHTVTVQMRYPRSGAFEHFMTRSDNDEVYPAGYGGLTIPEEGLYSFGSEIATSAPAGGSFEVVPLGYDCGDPSFEGWRYLLVSESDAVDRSAVSFDDSSWAYTQVPLGNGLAPEHSAQGWIAPKTTVAVNTGVWLRRSINVSSASVSVRVRRDGSAKVYWNGTEVATYGDGITETTIQIPKALVNNGANTIAVYAKDDAADPGGDYFYIEPVVTLTPRGGGFRGYSHDWAIVSGG
jgi:hypothetical protein